MLFKVLKLEPLDNDLVISDLVDEFGLAVDEVAIKPLLPELVILGVAPDLVVVVFVLVSPLLQPFVRSH